MINKKNHVKGLSVALIVLMMLTLVPVQGRRDHQSDDIRRLKVRITGVEVQDLESDGTADDAILSGMLFLKTTSKGEYPVTLELTLIYLGTEPNEEDWEEDGAEIIMTKTVVITVNRKKQNKERFDFEIYDLSGWYNAQIVASCDGVSARSNSIIFDPPGGTMGPPAL